jgi:hypothetical protein
MSIPPPPSRIFISYRRKDAGHVAGRLSDQIGIKIPSADVFMDVDTIELGVDFVARISEEVARCNVFIVIIGRQWLIAEDAEGRRRIDNPNDYVALEVAAALKRQISIIPVLVDGAEMPRPEELPSSLAGLARRNAARLDHETFRTNVQLILDAVKKALSSSPDDQQASVDRSAKSLPLPTQLPAHAEPTGSHTVVTTGSRPRPKTRAPSSSPPSEAWTIRESTLLGHDGGVAAVAVSGVDHRSVIVSGGDDGTVRLWDIVKGRPLGRPLEGHSAPVVSISTLKFAGCTLAVSASWDGSLRIWDLASGESVRVPLLGHEGEVNAVATYYSPGFSQRDQLSLRVMSWRQAWLH